MGRCPFGFYVFNFNQVYEDKRSLYCWTPPPDGSSDNELAMNIYTGTAYDGANLSKLQKSIFIKEQYDHHMYWSTAHGWKQLGYKIKPRQTGIWLRSPAPMLIHDDNENDE